MNFFGKVAVISLCLLVLSFSVLYAYNPTQQALQKTDEAKKQLANTFLSSVKRYQKKEKIELWEALLTQTNTPLPLNRLPAEIISVLRTKAPPAPNLASQYAADILVTADNQHISACFLPQSKRFIFAAQDNGFRRNGTRWCDLNSAGDDNCWYCLVEKYPFF